MRNDGMKWRMPECWTVSGAGGREVRIDVAQDGNGFVGTAHAETDGAAEAGTVNGSIDGDALTMTIYWPQARIVEYQATVAEDGAVTGTTGEARSSWSARPALTPWA